MYAPPARLHDPRPPWDGRPRWHAAAATLGVAAIYVVTARIGQSVALPPGNVTPVWLPSGIMFALALLWGWRIAPGVFLGAFAGNAWAYLSLTSAPIALRALAAGALNGAGDVLATVGMALLYRRLFRDRPPFDRVRDLIGFIGLGALAGGLISAAFGVGGLWATGFMVTETVPAAFLTWATGDGVGVLLFAPPLVAWSSGMPASWGARDRVLALAVVSVSLVAPAVFFGLIDVPAPLVFALVAVAPLVLWTALALGRRLAYLGLFNASMVTLFATALGAGPFQESGPTILLAHHQIGALVSLQLFLAGLSTTILLLSVLAAQRAAAQAGLLAANLQLERLSRTDTLTGLPNRMHLQDALDAALHRSARHGEPLSVVLVDIDHFKRVNDTWGHNTGDEVLRDVAGALRDGVRAGDTAGRWGGEEFLVLLERCDGPEALAVAGALRRRVAALSHPQAGGVRVSLGVAVAKPGTSAVRLVDRADGALYAAKAAGRDRVCCAAAGGRDAGRDAPAPTTAG